VECKGTALPCDERTEEQCLTDDTCELMPGRCEGEACDTYETEQACGVVQGCTWNDQPHCTGFHYECGGADCTETPGCYIE
jgi:hypothetical protein